MPPRTPTSRAPTAFVDDGLGNSSYLVDLGGGRGLVVDPVRHPVRYVAEAERRGLEIAFAVPCSWARARPSSTRPLIAAVGDVAHPRWRATAVGVYRLWRDTGYVVGGILGGLVADALDLRAAVWAVAVLSAASAAVVAVRMDPGSAGPPVVTPPRRPPRCSPPGTARP